MAPSRRSSPTLVFLVRHGKTPTTGSELPGRAPGLHLGDVGLAQAQAAAERFEGIAIDAVYASPLERTRETAAPIARAVGKRVRRHRGLLELDVGDWTGRRLSELRRLKDWQTVQRYPSGFTFPGGESFSDMQHRVTSALAALADEHRGGAIVCVSHADPIRAAVAHALGVHLDLFQRIVVGPCSVSVIALGDSGPMVLAVNTNAGPLSELRPA